MPGAARLGDKAQAPLDAHGCPACPHPTIGPAISGSPDVNVNGRPAVREADRGVHAACCGPNTFKTVAGSATVFVNGKAAVRLGDATSHCGGSGRMVEGSPNVIVGGSTSAGSGAGASATRGLAGSASGSAAPSSSSNAAAASSASSSSAARASQASTTGAATSSPSASSDGEPPAQPEKAHVHVVKAQLRSPGGQPLAFEQVVLVKPGTDEQVAGPFTTDATGSFGTVVAEPGQYDVRLVDDGSMHDPAMPPDARFVRQLCCQFLVNGVPAAGEQVMLSGGGVTRAVTLGPLGELQLAAGPGVYELTFRGQTFKASAVAIAALQALPGGYQFAVEEGS